MYEIVIFILLYLSIYLFLKSRPNSKCERSFLGKYRYID